MEENQMDQTVVCIASVFTEKFCARLYETSQGYIVKVFKGRTSKVLEEKTFTDFFQAEDFYESRLEIYQIV